MTAVEINDFCKESNVMNISATSFILIFVVIVILVWRSLTRSQRENIMKLKLSFVFSIVTIVAGAFLIWWSQMGPHTTRIEYVGTALVCTGLLSLTISEIFTKPEGTRKSPDEE